MNPNKFSDDVGKETVEIVFFEGHASYVYSLIQHPEVPCPSLGRHVYNTSLSRESKNGREERQRVH